MRREEMAASALINEMKNDLDDAATAIDDVFGFLGSSKRWWKRTTPDTISIKSFGPFGN